MKITIQEKSDTYLRFQAKDDPHTLFNLLKEIVLQEKGVKLCGYTRDETFSDSLVFQIRTVDGHDPVTILLDSTKKLMEINQQFRDAFQDTYRF
jgi:DNA-directed RNA polymerase subunit L